MDPSEGACIEILRPKTVPSGLLALGTISNITELFVKVHITGGVTCTIDRTSISEAYTRKLEQYSKTLNSVDSPARLNHIFRRGQQVVVKVLERRKRSAASEIEDIMVTTDPISIQEDNLSKTVLSIPQVPLQCSVESIEDHGYMMNIGFPGLLGFLPFEEAESYCKEHHKGKKLSIGQIVRCCLKTPVQDDDSTRVAQLSMTKELMKLSRFSTEKCSKNFLTHRCILPGSKGYCTVMKVLNNGLVVNFLDEFAGFVGMDHLANVWQSPKKKYKVSDQLPCTVLFYNSLTKTFSLSIRKNKEFKAMLKILLEDYRPGQEIDEAQVVFVNSTRSVNFKLRHNVRAIASVKDALEEDVATLTKDELVSTLETKFPEKSVHKGRVKAINLSDLIIILSLTEKEAPVENTIKSRRQRSEEARQKEEKLRQAENALMDTNRTPRSIPDFERLILKDPNQADSWIKYSKFFLDNVETEKARIVCRRALRTINFRLEKEKLRIWLQLIRIEAKYGGADQLREVIDEASQTNDQTNLYQSSAKVLTRCGELEFAENLYKLLLKSNRHSVDIWIEYLQFLMETRKEIDLARKQFEYAIKGMDKSHVVHLRSKFAQLEFKFGDVERGKTMFESLLSDNPKRVDLWRVYEAMVKKHGARQADNDDNREESEQLINSIEENIRMVSKKRKVK